MMLLGHELRPPVNLRLGEHTFSGPAFLVATLQHRVIKSKLIGPIWQRLRLATPFDSNGLPAISDLLRARRPSAILWRVRPVVIYSVKASVLRALTHISKKVQEVLSPSVAHDDASPAVVFVRCVRRGVASSFRGCPGLPCIRVSPCPRVPVSRPRFSYPLTSKATAVIRSSVAQTLAVGHHVTAAVAVTQPTDGVAVSLLGSGPHRYERSETLAGNVFETLFSGRHLTTLPAGGLS